MSAPSVSLSLLLCLLYLDSMERDVRDGLGNLFLDRRRIYGELHSPSSLSPLLPSPFSSPCSSLSLSLSLSFLTSSLPPLFVLSLPLSPLSTSSLSLSFLLLLFPLSPSPPPLLPPHHRWTRRRVPPCTLSIFVTCWVASDGRTGKKWATNQTLLSISSQKSPTLKVR